MCTLFSGCCWLRWCFILNFLSGLWETGQRTAQNSLENVTVSPTFPFHPNTAWDFDSAFELPEPVHVHHGLPQSSEVGWAGSTVSLPLGVREEKLRGLETAGQRLSQRRGQSVKTPPFLFLAHLSFTLWRTLKQSDDIVTLLKIFPFLALVFRIMSKLLNMLIRSFEIWPCSLL